MRTTLFEANPTAVYIVSVGNRKVRQPSIVVANEAAFDSKCRFVTPDVLHLV